MCHHYTKTRETEETAEELADDTVHDEERPAPSPGSPLIDRPVKVLKQVTARLG